MDTRETQQYTQQDGTSFLRSDLGLTLETAQVFVQKNMMTAHMWICTCVCHLLCVLCTCDSPRQSKSCCALSTFVLATKTAIERLTYRLGLLKKLESPFYNLHDLKTFG